MHVSYLARSVVLVKTSGDRNLFSDVFYKASKCKINILICKMHLYYFDRSLFLVIYVFSFSITLSDLNYLGDALQELDEDLDDDSELSTDSKEDMFYRSVKCKIELGYVLLSLENKILAFWVTARASAWWWFHDR